jgi:hypothetical protein
MSRNVSAIVFAVVIAAGAILLLLDERVSYERIIAPFTGEDVNPPN